MDNLYTTYDDEGNTHHWIGDREVPKDEWVQQHPHLRRELGDGRSSGTSGEDGNPRFGGERFSRFRARIKGGATPADAERKDQVGQPETGPQQT